jgi:plastocyanin
MFRKLLACAAIAASLAMPVGLANAQTGATTHTILMYANGYFPKTLYVKAGDKINFVNNTGYYAYAPNANGTSLFSWINNGTTKQITVPGTTNFTMNKPVLWNVSNSNGRQGFIVFGTAPSQ